MWSASRPPAAPTGGPAERPAFHGRDHRLEDHQAVGAAEHRLTRPLGVRHQADDVARLVAEAGDRRRRSVRIGRVADAPVGVGVAEDDLPVGLEPGDDVRLGEVVALAVGDRNAEDLSADGTRA